MQRFSGLQTGVLTKIQFVIAFAGGMSDPLIRVRLTKKIQISES